MLIKMARNRRCSGGWVHPEARPSSASEHIPNPVCDMSIAIDPDGNQLILHQLKNEQG
jgi:hypothetical protein